MIRLSNLLVLAALLAAAPLAADGPVELAGSYVLPDGEWETIEATFTANGSESWRVEFRFEFQGRSETWNGSATGSLTDGPLEGSVHVDERSFVFRGAASAGVLQATHAELERGAETPTGTMTLSPIAGPAAGAAAAGDGDETRNSDNTLRLADGAPRPAAKIDDLAWLAGYWKGEGFGGELEELWLPAAGDRMHGIFTLTQEGKAVFSEAMMLAEEEGSLVLRVKHFTPEFVGWEDKDGFVRFPLVRLNENEAFFRGLTIRRKGEALAIYIVLSQGGERTEHELLLERVPL